MTEYWKSNARKFCDYCKCWFADNRPSIEFHEAGKKHKENVAKRLQEIGKRGKADYETSLKMDDYMKQMEQAALAAYRDDIDSNPDLTGSEFVQLAKERNASIVLKAGDRPKPAPTISLPPGEQKWHEAKSKDGHSYYYHLDTKETRWQKPKEGFLSIEEQKQLKKDKKNKPDDKKRKEGDDSNSSKSSKKPKPDNSSSSSVVAVKPVTDLKNKTNVPTTIQNQPPDANSELPSRFKQSQGGFGQWTVVEKPVMPELQLPGWEDQEQEDYTSYVSLREEPHQFTQKTVALSGTSASTSFKKKKNSDFNKKNARTRNNDL